MKKKIAALLCIIVAIGLMTGCGNRKQTDSAGNTEKSSSEISDSNTNEQATQTQEETATEQTTQVSENKDAYITYETQQNTYTTDDGSTTLLYTFYQQPTITMTGNETAVAEINNNLDGEKKTFENESQTSLSDATSWQKEEPDGFASYFYSVEYATKRCDSQVISIRERTDESAGGAHGEYTYKGLNYDTATGKLLTLDDITTDKEALLTSARTYILDQLKQPHYQEMIFDPEADNSALLDESVLVDGAWYFDEAGLTFVANIELLAPYAAGAFNFTIPYENLAGLKEEYQYTGAYQLEGAIGTTLKADLDGDGSVDSVCYDATEDETTYSAVSKLTINGVDYSDKVMDDLSDSSWIEQEYYIVDLDASDNTLELALLSNGPSNDLMTYFYRYTGDDLVSMGPVGDKLSEFSCRINGDGTINASERKDMIETSWEFVNYKIGSDGKLEQITSDWYLVNHTYWDAVSRYHNILKDITVYKANSLDAEQVVLTATDGPVDFLATDNQHWIKLATADETIYYLYIKDVSVLENDENAQDVFDNLTMAD